MSGRAEGEQPHFDPAVVEWSIPEEGLAARVWIDHPAMQELPTEAREKFGLALQRFTLLCELAVAEQKAIEGGGLPVERAFGFIAEQLKDMTSFLQGVGKIDGEGVPF